MSRRSYSRVAIGGLDQALSSLTNVLFLVAFARTSSSVDYGALSVAMAALVFGMGISRAALGTLFAVRGGGMGNFQGEEARFLFASSFIGVSLTLPAVIAIGVYTGSLERLGAVYLVFAVTGSLALCQDVLRFAAISFLRPLVALFGDALWFACVAIPLSLNLAHVWLPGDGTAFVFAWGLGLLASLVIMAMSLRAVPQSRGLGSWCKQNALTLHRLLADGVLGTSVALIVAVGTAKFLSLQDAAGLRGASTLIGPIAVIFSAIPLVVLPELSMATEQQLRRAKILLPASLAIFVMLFGGTLTLLPESVGQGLLGDSWALAGRVLPIITVEYVLWATAVFPVMEMKVRERYGEILMSRFVYVATALIGLCVGLFYVHSVRGVAYGLAFAVFVHSVTAWFLAEHSRGYARS